MRSAFATLALAALAAGNPMPQGVTSAIAPKSSPPAGCSENFDGTFSIAVVNVTSHGKREVWKRDTKLVISLKDGVLTDSQGRTGYIAANNQFQFDDPPQTGAIYTAGFSVCAGNKMAIGGDMKWYKCLSGTFYNLYDDNNSAQCSPIWIVAVPSSGSSPASASAVATEQPDGQPTATPVPMCSEYVDGQPQCSSAAPVPECSEYVDGQPQCSSAAPTPECSEYVDGQPQCSSAAPTPECSEYVDGQPQCSSAAPTPECSEYVDGQPQCSSAAPSPTAECSEYVDGQPQCSSAAPAPTAECSEYVDGQPQCSSVAPVPNCSEYVDGQPQCSGYAPATGTVYKATGTGGYPKSSYTGPAIQTNAAQTMHREIFGLAAGVLAVAML